MPQLELSAGNGLAYDHQPPSRADGLTFVFVNALTGDKGMWESTIASALRAEGHGSLVYNLRGQAGSPFTQESIEEATIVADLVALMGQVKPVRPVYVGLSIGGLFAIKAHLAGGTARAAGLVLINTLRRHGPRLAWINQAIVRAAEVGGLDLVRDLYSPLLLNEEFQEANRGSFLLREQYEPVAHDDGAYLLLKSGIGADWEVDYGVLDLPVLVITGLQDRVFYDKTDVDSLFGWLPRGRRVDLADAGHMIPVERPEALAAALLAFAKDLRVGA